MTTDNDEVKEMASAISFWLDEKNASARKELAERNEALSMWLDKVEAMVQQKLREVEKEEVRAKV
jgi:dsDNA-binding SOS-regulon protein